MTETAVIHTDQAESHAAGCSLGEQIATRFEGRPPDALVLFASSRYDYATLLAALRAACRPVLLIGCSSAGEFTGPRPQQHSACAVALRSDEMQFSGGLGQGLSLDPAAAARELVGSFQGLRGQEYLYRTALVMTDALAGHADELVEALTLLTAGTYQLVGGGAGDDAHFHRTHVFFGTEAVPDAVVGLEILSNKPLGVGVHHGWRPVTPGLRVTAAEGTRLISLNAFPAVQAFAALARETGEPFDPANPLPFFLHHVLGIDTGVGYKLRVPLAAHPDGSIQCAAEIPVGATVKVMSAAEASPGAAARAAVEGAVAQLAGHRPGAALFFDCVATRLRMGGEFGFELAAIQGALGAAPFAGCNTYGQIARAEGQFSGFHNCTAVVCVLPE